MKNILFINHDSYPKEVGGIKRVSLILAEEFSKLGYACHFLHATNLPDDLSPLPYPSIVIPELRQGCYDEGCVKKVLDYVRNNDIEIVFNQHCDIIPLSELVASLKAQLPIKVISTLHFSPRHDIDVARAMFFNRYRLGRSAKAWITNILVYIKFNLFGQKQIKSRLKKKFEYIASHSDRMVLLSEAYKTDVLNIAPDINLDTISAINNPMRRFNVVNTSKRKSIVWAGRVGFDMKRTDLLLRIWAKAQAQLPDWELHVLGGGQCEHFKTIAQREGLKNIHFQGFTNPFPYYSEASILCSTSATEGLPMNILEGMAHGCVPISFDSFGSIRDIITADTDGIIVKSFDTAEYARRLVALAKDSEKMERMSQAAIKKVADFAPEHIASQWQRLIEEL